MKSYIFLEPVHFKTLDKKVWFMNDCCYDVIEIMENAISHLMKLKLMCRLIIIFFKHINYTNKCVIKINFNFTQMTVNVS